MILLHIFTAQKTGAGYLYTTVRNHAVNHLQRERKENAFLNYAFEDLEKEYEFVMINDYPAANLILQDINKKIIGKLPCYLNRAFLSPITRWLFPMAESGHFNNFQEKIKELTFQTAPV